MDNFKGVLSGGMNQQYLGGNYHGYGNEQENLYPVMNMQQQMTASVNPGFSMNQDQSMNYYQEYCKLFVANVVLTNQIKELIAEKNELQARVAKLENGGGGGGFDKQTPQQVAPKKKEETGTASSKQSVQDDFQDKKKRFRRTASEIEKHFQCPVSTCQKAYGSEGALLQHARLKHPEMADDIKSKLPK